MKGTGHLPDLLAGLTLRDRRKRVIADAQYLMQHTDAVRHPDADAELSFLGLPQAALDTSRLRPMAPGTTPDFIVCARVDLDNPIYFADNIITQCADCGCDVQHRPHAPKGERLCVCCAARRARLDAAIP